MNRLKIMHTGASLPGETGYRGLRMFSCLLIVLLPAIMLTYRLCYFARE